MGTATGTTRGRATPTKGGTEMAQHGTAAKGAAVGGGTWGLMAEFADISAIYHAAQRVRDAGFTKWDVYAPFPIHGIDEAMGMPRSKVGWAMGTAAACGLATAIAMQWWMSGVDYPINTAGKPYTAWEQFMPVMFELSVLFSAFGALLGMLGLNGLPRWHHPLLKRERFLRVSDDRFVIAIESADPKFDSARTRRLLEEAGATNIEVVEP